MRIYWGIVDYNGELLASTVSYSRKGAWIVAFENLATPKEELISMGYRIRKLAIEVLPARTGRRKKATTP